MSEHEDPESARLSEPLLRALAELHSVTDAHVHGLIDAIELRTSVAEPPLDARIVAALSVEPDRALAPQVMAKIEALLAEPHAPLPLALPEPDASFLPSTLAKLEALEAPALDPRIVRAIAEDVARGFDASLSQHVMQRIEAEIERELGGEGAGLAEIRAELARESERMQSARVVSEVTAELRSIGPRLEREMPRAVETRIREEAKPISLDAARKRRGIGRGAVAAVLAMAAALLLVLRGPGAETPGLPQLDPGGEVHVEAVSFDGTVTVTETDGMAVIWLSDEPMT